MSILIRRLKEGVRSAKIRWERRNFHNCNPILVLQMGKVGSSSVVRALEQANCARPILHLHLVAQASIDAAVSRIRTSRFPAFDQHVLESVIVGRRLRTARSPLDIITLTREPVARILSLVFQDMRREIGPPPYERHHAGPFCERVIEKLRQQPVHHDPGKWFDKEIRATFGIDIMEADFRYDLRYAAARNKRANVLSLRMEDFGDKRVDDAISDFLTVPCTILNTRTNAGVAKEYGSLYNEFLQSFRLPRDLAESIYSTRYCSHFYSLERDMLLSKWTQ